MNRFLLTISLCCLLTPSILPAQPQEKKSAKQSSLATIGAVETVVLLKTEHRVQLEARIDTGAETSSITAKNIEEFERDGKPWVRFTIEHKDQKTTMSAPLVRTVEIKRHGAEGVKRPVVRLQIAMGKIRSNTEFSLTDRSKFEYPVLIGRSFLKGVAIVDVAGDHLTHPITQEELQNEN